MLTSVLRKLALAVVCTVLSGALPVLAADNSKTVLVLHSYHKADWTDSLMDGIESVFQERSGIELRVEYMDTKTAYNSEYLQVLAAIYRQKYESIHFDLILTSDDNALLFALEHQEGIFKGAPVVFCGVNRYQPSLRRDHPEVTGVVERGDFRETLESIKSLMPETKRLGVICDQTRTGLVNLSGFQKVANEYFQEWDYRLLQDVTFKELASKLENPEDMEAAFFISFWSDSERRPVNPTDLEDVFRKSRIPVFGRSEWMIDRGLVGGKVVHGYSQGREAALLAIKILDGTPARSLAVLTESPNKFIFDWKELQRHNLDERNLPNGSLLINRPPPFYAIDKRVAAMLILSLLLLTAFSVALATMNAKRSASQKLLKASEERYRSLVDNIELGITLIDDQYRVVMTNVAQGALLKRPARELVGLYCFKEFEKRDAVCPHCPGKEAMQTGRAAVAETGGVRDDGSRISVRINAFPLKDDHGRAKGFIEVVEDITARKKHEEELKQTYEKLREQNLELKKLDRIKDALISDVSHELKTPVAKHQMYLEVLKSVLETGAPMGRIESVIQILEEGVRRQQQVIRNILVLSRLEEGGHGFERKTVLLGEIVKEVLADYGELTGTLGINIQTQLNPVKIETDREMLLHVVSNLVENSIKYRSPEKPRILVTVGAEEGLPVISVQDNGIGMTAEERKRALDRFYQSTVSKEGIGLGLHICKRIVKRLGGEITLSSAGRGRGTEVKVTMPPLSG